MNIYLSKKIEWSANGNSAVQWIKDINQCSLPIGGFFQLKEINLCID
jgi:hypothetical protein